MAEDQDQGNDGIEPKKNNLPIIIIAVAVVLSLGAVGAIMMLNSGPSVPVEPNSAEYLVENKMYQLKDGSYLRLGFSIVTTENTLEKVKNILEKEAPGRLPNGITMILGNKGREDLIDGRHKRESFSRELKKMLEERVFAEFNNKQTSSKDMIEIREVLISDYVTQSG